MGLLEPLTHSEEIESLMSEAQSKYDESKNKFESQKKKTTKSLEKLGKAKVKAWSDGMNSFVDNFKAFNNIEVVQTIDTNMDFIGSKEEPQEIIVNMEQASLTASEVAQAGIAAVGTGALVGIASYGGAMMFGTASTGTAISALHGAAKENATLAWFGGGSKESGGLGIDGGKLVLGGIAIASVAVVGALINHSKAKEKLAEAKKINAEALEAAAKIDVMTSAMLGIEKMSDNYTDFISKLGKKFRPFINEMERIRNAHPVAAGEQIDFNSLTMVEQKTLHLSWLMAQIYYHVLSTPILTCQGEVSSNAGKVISVANTEYKQFKKDTYKMTGDDAKAADLLWRSSARNMAVVNFIIVGAFLVIAFTIAPTIASTIIFIAGAAIAIPIFFKFNDLSASKMYTWRKVRAIAAVAFVIVIHILMRVI